MNSDSFTLPSYAKINWFLRVLGKRKEDNYHELCTAFQTVSLNDYITFQKGNELSLTCDDPKIPTTDENLIIKAAELLNNKFNTKYGAKIHLEKRIPSPGGLGGGSSNAAVTLLGLSTLWALDTGFEELFKLGTKLGADVPFFLNGGTALGMGTGTEIKQTKQVQKNHLLIVTPNVSISTAVAYAKLNAPYLTKKDGKSILTICRNLANRLNSKGFQLENDFEKSVLNAYKEVKEIKEKLLEVGAIQALLSGSGASVFGVFDNKEKQQLALTKFNGVKTKKFAVQTVSREAYIDSLEPCKHLIPKSL